MRDDAELDREVQGCVPFVPFRCPVCGRHKPRTYGRRGRIRWHHCLACGSRYKSWEIEAAALRDPVELRKQMPPL